MQQTLQVVLTKFTDETIMITFMVLLIVTCILIVYWVYNRRKYRELSHQIPASVVKNYLDSIIQNSTALKSSLFRGGGLEVGEGVPSVVPARDFPAGDSVAVGGASPEELNQKNAEISSLNSQLADKSRVIGDLERTITELRANSSDGGDSAEEISILKGELDSCQVKIGDLTEELESAKAAAAAAAEGGGGGDPEVEAKLTEVTKERDELKERLMEYEIIEEDLANLKRFQQENEQLKKSLAAYEGGGAAAAAVAAEAAPAEEGPAPAPEPEPSEEPAPAEDDLEAQMAAAITEGAAEEPAAEAPAAEEAPAPEPEGAVPENEGEQKSAEELLGEFEKMLG